MSSTLPRARRARPVPPDPRSSCFYARRALELAVVWLYKHDPALNLPYQEQLAALIHDPTFKQTTGPALFAKARLIKDLGNLAAHSPKPLMEKDSLRAVEDLFHFLFWLARTYSRMAAPPDGIAFDASILPSEAASPRSIAQIQKLESDLQSRDETLYDLIADRQNIDAELQRLREEIAAIKAANNAKPDTHDYFEAETRDYFIDLLLKEAGWPLSGQDDLEFEVRGIAHEGWEEQWPGIRRRRPVGRRRQTARHRRGEADAERLTHRPAAGKVLR